ncbi:glycosyl hydrolase [Niveibacterium sp. SC-1]|uniref:glycoside hydrolase family 26 protein n=1 Tax=Niveibacterium sp. SC-1 TaxID=3135646 RepID=UPI00311DE611
MSTPVMFKPAMSTPAMFKPALLLALLTCLSLPLQAAESSAERLDAALAQPVREDAAAARKDGVFFGIFRAGDLTDLAEDAPADLRFKPASVMWFTRFGGGNFPESEIAFLWSKGYVAQVTWEPMDWKGEGVSLQAVIDGKWDEYLDTYAKAAAKQNIPFMLRWGHEFNGDWYPWSITKNGNNAKLYAAAFRHVVDRFRKAGAHKVQFVWCYNNEGVPKSIDPFDAWPGDEYVDWIGIDGYNWGRSQSWSKWASFEETFGPAYALAAKYAPGKPIVIGEMASSEVGGDKAAWLKDMFAVLPRYPAIRALTWFDLNKETNWSLSSSDEVYLAFIKGLEQPYWRGNAEALIAVAAKPPKP